MTALPVSYESWQIHFRIAETVLDLWITSTEEGSDLVLDRKQENTRNCTHFIRNVSIT
jgi:hypothetical protein